jgi:hypothetical protein
MTREDLKAGDKVKVTVKPEISDIGSFVVIVKRRCTEYARCWCEELNEFWDVYYDSMVFADPERNKVLAEKESVTEDNLIYAPKSKIEKDQITVYGAGTFQETSLRLNKARASLLMIELWEFLNQDEKTDR